MIDTKGSRLAAVVLALALTGGASTSVLAATPAAKGMMSHEKMGEDQKMVGGTAMYPSKNIIQNAVNSMDHTTLVAAVKAAGLVATLEGPGPFTLFAPTNAAFAVLPAGTVETLLKPENKAALTSVLTYHVVAGKVSSKQLTAMIATGGGAAVLTTVEGEKLTATRANGKIMLTDTKGRVSQVTIADVDQSNGVIHVVDGVLLPS